MIKNDIKMSLRLPEELHTQLKKKYGYTGVSKVLRDVLQSNLTQQEAKYDKFKMCCRCNKHFEFHDLILGGVFPASENPDSLDFIQPIICKACKEQVITMEDPKNDDDDLWFVQKWCFHPENKSFGELGGESIQVVADWSLEFPEWITFKDGYFTTYRHNEPEEIKQAVKNSYQS